MINHQSLLADLKNRKFSPVYLLHGEEPYYIDLISDHIEEQVLSEGEKSFNQTIFYGRDTDMLTVMNAVKRYPMMSDHQVVIIKEAQDLKLGKEADDGKKTHDPFLSYLENPLPSTILVLCYKYAKLDKRKKIYKAIDKGGVILESAPVYESKMPGWIEDFVRTKGYRIHARAAALLAEYLGNDLSKVVNELDKIMLNVVAANEISVEDIQKYTGISKEYNVFELQAALAKKDILKVNQIINYFAANPKANPVPLIMGNLNTYFSKILRFHYTTDRSQQNLARELGVNPFFVKDYELAGRSFPAGKVVNVISFLREYDLKTKGVDASSNTSYADLLKELLYKIIH